MTTEGLIERLRATSEKCRYFAATASDREVAESLIQLAEEMEVAISAVAEDAESRAD